MNHESVRSPFMAVLMVAAALMTTSGDGIAQSPAGGAENTPSGRMLGKVAEFRALAKSEPEAAFTRFTGNREKARILFGALGRKLCPTTDPSAGWRYFFDTSHWTVTFPNFNTAAAVFHHPWSDVALVTVWTRNDAGTTLSDAELLVGDILRNQGKSPFDIEPQWSRSPLPAYLAAGVSSAKTLRVSEWIFSPANLASKKSWRSAIPSVANAGTLAANHLAAGSMFERNLAWLTQYMTEPSMAPARNLTGQILRQIGQNQMEEVFRSAPETTPETRSILAKHADLWKQAKVITCLTKRDDQQNGDTFVLLSTPEMPTFVMSLWFSQTAGRALELKRIDLTDPGRIYQNLDAIETMTQGTLSNGG
jgi:hypothetical protein